MATYTAFPSRPYAANLNLGSSFGGGLVYAANFGIPRGWSRVGAQDQSVRNLVSNRPGIIGGAPDLTNFSQGLPAGNIHSGTGPPVISINYSNLSMTPFPAQASIFALVRSFDFNGDRIVAGAKNSLLAVDPGIALHTTGGSEWGCTVSDGTTQQRTDTTGGARVVGVLGWQSICASYNSSGEFFNFFVNGQGNPFPSPLGIVPNLGTPANASAFNGFGGQIACLYVWRRALSRVQVMQLHADPFLPLRYLEGRTPMAMGRQERPF